MLRDECRTISLFKNYFALGAKKSKLKNLVVIGSHDWSELKYRSTVSACDR
jgi:hypothetical protein